MALGKGDQFKMDEQDEDDVDYIQDMIDDIHPVVDVLREVGAFNKETLCAVLMSGCVEPNEVYPFNNLLSPEIQEVVEAFFLEDVRGMNVLYATDKFAPLIACLADIISQSRQGMSGHFNAEACSGDKQDKDDNPVAILGFEMSEHADRIELCQLWDKIPPKLMSAFCKAMDAVAFKLDANDAYENKLKMSLLTQSGILSSYVEAAQKTHKSLTRVKGKPGFSAN